jgi:CHAT domain-containing protein/tetratricopeptide (TPR) repeat protein
LTVSLGVSGCQRGGVVPHPEAVYREAESRFQQGDLIAAYQESDAAYNQLAGQNPEWASRFRVLEAEILVWRGLSNDALNLLQPPLAPSLNPGDIGVRRELVLGLAQTSLQNFDEAEAHFTEADRLAALYQPGLRGEILLARGNLSYARGDYHSAENAYLQSLLFARGNRQTFLTLKSLGSLGAASMEEEHFDESIDWDEQALQVSRSLGARTATEKVVGNLGRNYYKMGDFDRALSLLTEAKNASLQLGVNTDEMRWLMNIGEIEHGQNLYIAAERDFQQALILARGLQNKTSIATCLSNLAVVELREGNYDAAGLHNNEALALEREDGDRPRLLQSMITDGYVAADKNEFAAAKLDFTQVIREKTLDRYLTRQAEVGLADVFVAAKQPADAEAHFKKAMATIEAARSSVRREDLRLSFLSGVAGFYGDYIDFLVSQRRTEEALQVAEVSRARTLAEGLGFSSLSVNFPLKNFRPQQTVKQLGSAIFSYWLGLDHSYLWVITRERVELFTLPPAAEIDPLVQSYRQALLASRDVLETQNAAGRKLYDLLIAPAAKLIPKGARVTILPDGSLYGLNFETLLAPSPELHYWIEDVDVSYANSLTLLAAGASRHATAAKKLLLVGDPVSPDAEFPKLPQAAAEMTGIENYFPAAERTVFSGAEATPDSYLKSQPAGFSYIHFVAHGTASRTSPLDSAVILSKQGDDYKLYARDIIQHPLHADLVTISACHGEGVRTYSGEGLVGLSWAFLHAGAHGVIAALWEVNDNSTPQLMDRLYSEIGKGVPPDAALRDAKLALLHSGGVYRRPFYWAPFELYRGS